MQALYNNPTFLLCLTTLFWGGNAVASQFAVGHVSPLFVTFLRWLFAFIFLWALFGRQVRASWHEAKPHIKLMLLMAFLGFTGFNSIFYVAAQTTGAINIGILQGTIPVIVAIGSFFLFGTTVTARQIIGIGLTMIGALTVASKGSLETFRALDFNHGDLLMLGACCLYAGYTLLIKKRPQISPPVFMTLLALFALLETTPLAIIEIAQGDFIMPTLQGWIVSLYVGFGVAAISQLAFMRATDIVGPVKAGVYVNLVPIMAAALSILLLDEHFQFYHGLSLTLVMLGIYLAQKSA